MLLSFACERWVFLCCGEDFLCPVMRNPDRKGLKTVSLIYPREIGRSAWRVVKRISEKGHDGEMWRASSRCRRFCSGQSWTAP